MMMISIHVLIAAAGSAIVTSAIWWWAMRRAIDRARAEGRREELLDILVDEMTDRVDPTTQIYRHYHA